MDIEFFDVFGEYGELYISDKHPKERLPIARATIINDDDGLQQRISRVLSADDPWRDVMKTVLHDAHEFLAGTALWGAFNPIRKREASAWAFEQIRDWLPELERWFGELAAEQPELIRLEKLVVFILPADPANRGVMVGGHGISAFGGAKGLILVQVWPSEGNLVRLKMALARALGQQLGRMQHNPNEPWALGELVAIEGRALTLAEQATGQPWTHLFNAADDWAAALARVAELYELDAFEQMVTNVYGNQVSMAGGKPPLAKALGSDELAYSAEIIRAAASETDPNRIAAYLYGDELMGAQGHKGEGLAAYAGFAVGVEMMRTKSARSKR